jgi:hypothetical protein
MLSEYTKSIMICYFLSLEIKEPLSILFSYTDSLFWFYKETLYEFLASYILAAYPTNTVSV